MASDNDPDDPYERLASLVGAQKNFVVQTTRSWSMLSVTFQERLDNFPSVAQQIQTFVSESLCLSESSQ